METELNISGMMWLFISAMLLVLVITPLIIRLAVRIGAVAVPDARRQHATPTPLLGGLGITITFGATVLLLVGNDPLITALLAGLGIIVLTGLVDDIRHLPPWLKFTGEITAATVFVVFSGATLQSFGDLLGAGPLTTGRVAIPVTIFCMVGVMNAWNMVDGLDGLAAGLSAVACLFLGWFAYSSGHEPVLAMMMILSGSLTGFLVFNWHPARLFMGDTGSLSLGYLLSAICIVLVQADDYAQAVPPVSMAILMGLPIVDAIRVMSVRLLRGQNPFHPDQNHLHHRLQMLGLIHPVAVIILCLVMVSCGMLAVMMSGLREWVQFYSGSLYAALIFGTVLLWKRR